MQTEAHWRSQQRREEQAEAEAATAVASEEPDFDTGQAEACKEQGSDVADVDIDRPEPMTKARLLSPSLKPTASTGKRNAKRAVMTTAAMCNQW